MLLRQHGRFDQNRLSQDKTGVYAMQVHGLACFAEIRDCYEFLLALVWEQSNLVPRVLFVLAAS